MIIGDYAEIRGHIGLCWGHSGSCSTSIEAVSVPYLGQFVRILAHCRPDFVACLVACFVAFFGGLFGSLLVSRGGAENRTCEGMG